MLSVERTLAMYLHLARASQMRRQPLVSDKLLVLAGVAAQEMGMDDIASLCRQRILEHNAFHLVRDWPSIAAAMSDERFQTYLKQLRRRYAPEKAEHMLDSLGIELGNERDSYYSDREYAAALLGVKLADIDSRLSSDPVEGTSTADRPSQSQPLRSHGWSPGAIAVAAALAAAAAVGAALLLAQAR